MNEKLLAEMERMNGFEPYVAEKEEDKNESVSCATSTQCGS